MWSECHSASVTTVTTDEHWVQWHAGYDDPTSSLSRRLAVVQQRLRTAINEYAPGPIRLISVCAGQGHDVLGVLADHPRRLDVTARLVELDPHLVAAARKRAFEAGLNGVEIVEGDASLTSAYSGAVPADVVLICGVFGNINDDDILNTITELRHLCAPGAIVIWTRHRRKPDLTPTIREWFAGAGFQEIAFDADHDVAFGVGTNRILGDVDPFQSDRKLFQFIGDGSDAHF